MRKNTFKSLIGVAMATMVLGAAVGVSMSAPKAAAEVKAESSLFAKDDYVYIRFDSGFWGGSATAWANYRKPDTNDWVCEKITDTIGTKGDETLYTYKFSNNAANFQILRKNSDGSSQWGYTNQFTSRSTNLFDVYETTYYGKENMNARFATASVNHITLTQPATGGTISVHRDSDSSKNGDGYYYSDWNLVFTASPSAGYYFKNWTDGAGTDWSGSDATTNPVTLNNLSGEFGVSCKFGAYADKVWKVLGNSAEPWDAQHQNIEIVLPYQSGSAEGSSGPQYYKTNVSFVAGAVFKIVDFNAQPNVYYGYDHLEEGDGSAKGIYVEAADESADANIKVKTAGTYEIYVKANTGMIWMQISSESEAKAYAIEFVDTITCSGAGSVTFTIDRWNIVGEAKTSMEYKYQHLTQGAKHLLNGTTATSDADILACRERYDEVLKKHGYGEGEGQYHDFMDRKPSLKPYIQPIIPGLFNSETNSVWIWIIVATAVAGLGVGTFFFIKRRKEDR